MTGFSADWLALREPADHKARSPEILSAFTQLFADREAISVLDLGAGSGSNLRFCAEHLPHQQAWRLVDYDCRLIEAARDALSGWSDESASSSNGLGLRRGDRAIEVAFEQIDLSADLERAIDGPINLVTAAAFFDLVSPKWIERFAAALAARGLPLYAVLIYNGEESWDPRHPSDQAVNAAFNRHQCTDKGFGSAAGPSASGNLEKALRSHGYDVVTGASPWRLGEQDGRLMGNLADGIANAAAEWGTVPPAEIDAWRRARLSATSCIIGHTDLLATPPAVQRRP